VNQRFFLCKNFAKIQKKKKKKKVLEKPILEKNGLKKRAPYFDLSKARDATHAMHGIDPLLLALQDIHSSSPHFLKQRPIVIISRLPLLDVANFIMA
jgi:hypothetical protein